MGHYRRREYHDDYHMSHWRSTESPRQLFGIELEVEDRVSYTNVLEALPDPGRGRDRPDVEEDGSISRARGVEIIFPPYSPRTIRSADSFFAKCLLALNASSAQATDRCGLHVNVNCTNWDKATKLHYSLMFEVLTPGQLYNIGGRLPNDYCAQSLSCGDWDVEHPKHYLLFSEDNHDNVTSYRTNRIELRFPKATFNHEKVVMITHLSDCVLAFVRSDRGDSAMRELVQYWDSEMATEMLEKVNDVFLDYLKSIGTRFKADEVLRILNDAPC